MDLNWLRKTLAFTERQNFSSGVNMLTNSLNISDTTKTKFFELIFCLSHQKIWQKYCLADLSSLSDPFTCSLSISVLTRAFLGIEVTLIFEVFNFRKKYPARLIYFLKVLQILFRLRKCRKNFRKYILICRYLHLNWFP